VSQSRYWLSASDGRAFRLLDKESSMLRAPSRAGAMHLPEVQTEYMTCKSSATRRWCGPGRRAARIGESPVGRGNNPKDSTSSSGCRSPARRRSWFFAGRGSRVLSVMFSEAATWQVAARRAIRDGPVQIAPAGAASRHEFPISGRGTRGRSLASAPPLDSGRLVMLRAPRSAPPARAARRGRDRPPTRRANRS
jgi:hypothetical protein